ncbi:unnamed protein product [Didymodactylos carnosus]|uniref:Uncharacterized protein n=1 Tax=Didymodactylos carnosus TaxID=1234261 RepID=A0A814MC00_9BILA|nr:unnamed protein product [Didymodactylos carnosus]CAF1181164.1 unnamed protein product [Didymodactylos carnosus]CAF3842224.1 unnamed protein product [Didymodactylos carnosus]CAF3992458.1 unnamed protein product [Didymodactylos carnosus]
MSFAQSQPSSVSPYSNVVPYNYNNNPSYHGPSSFDLAKNDSFFGYQNPGAALHAITPATNGRPIQTITAVGGTIPDITQFGGSFFDLRSPEEIFADMDQKLGRQRDAALASPAAMKMLR